MHEVCLIRIKKQVSESRAEIHKNDECLLKNTFKKTKNQEVTGVLRFFTLVKARSLKLTGEIPGIADKHFCVPE
jgi:hypothetical protein